MIQFLGCLVFNNIYYDISLKPDGSGSATVLIEDINSDALTPEEFTNDSIYIFDYAHKSEQFILDMDYEGKKIIRRELSVDGNKLNAFVSFNFDSLKNVESIGFDDPYYFLTLEPTDSIIYTNGQVIESENYKRIIWDKYFTTLKFRIFSSNTNTGGIKSLAPYLKN
jgi:hypothetical protein